MVYFMYKVDFMKDVKVTGYFTCIENTGLVSSGIFRAMFKARAMINFVYSQVLMHACTTILLTFKRN